MTDRYSPEALREWGRHTHGSPLYARLVEVTADNPELLSVVQRIKNKPAPNLFFAAIHYLLMADRDLKLAAFYPSLADHPRPVSDVDSHFTDFVMANSGRIIEISNNRYTQTNECRRCTALLPAAMTSPFSDFDLVEIGASAGLNLAMDRYRYNFGGAEWGPDSPVSLQADFRGDPPQLREIVIGRRIGIDINILDRRDPEDARWLLALVWPEHHERRSRLQQALDLTSNMDIEMRQGSAIDELDTILNDLPSGRPVVISNSFVLNQMTTDERLELSEIIDQNRSQRPIYRVSLEYRDWSDDWARLEVGGGMELEQLGQAHPHGEWVELNFDALRGDPLSG